METPRRLWQARGWFIRVLFAVVFARHRPAQPASDGLAAHDPALEVAGNTVAQPLPVQSASWLLPPTTQYELPVG